MYYVHNNPNNIIFNDYVYVFLRSWHMPTTPQLTLTEDTWLKLPALRTDLPNNGAHYSICNPNSGIASMATINSLGVLIKLGNTQPKKQIEPDVFDNIRESSVDVSSWEFTHKQSWPYENMFSKIEIKKRYDAKYGATSTMFEPTIINSGYTVLAKQFKKGCNCGKRK